MKKGLLTLCLVLLVGILLISRGWGQPRAGTKDFMRFKLSYAQKVLEGLALEDFDLIAKNAQQLSLVSQAQQWQVMQTEDYLDDSRDFRRSADALTEAARKKNLDGAALAYLQMTMKCIHCHKYVRGKRVAGSD